MRILELTPACRTRLLRARTRPDTEAGRVAALIIADVRRYGDAALGRWSRRLDGPLERPLRVSFRELDRARRAASPTLVRAVRRSARNVRRVAAHQLPRSWSFEVEPGVRVGQLVRSINAVGCYVPGGRYPLVSTMIMTVVPALTAGVRRIAVVCPRPGPDMLAAAAILGVTEIWRLGGVQAVAALAYGTQSIRPVDKIVGPGNRWVAAAKHLVAADCAVDLPAGPTEALILAGDGDDPRLIAADLVAQAEHDPDAVAILLTTSRSTAFTVRGEVGRALENLPPQSPAHRAIARHGLILLARSKRDAMEFANNFAPEHWSIPGASRSLIRAVKSAGTVLLGPLTAPALGDYSTGANHTLPTGGAARSRGGLSAADFVKCITVQQVTDPGLARIAPTAVSLARAEGLPAHARSIELRCG